MARIVAPGYPHHITQRGNRRQQTFLRIRQSYLPVSDMWRTIRFVRSYAIVLINGDTIKE